MVWVRHSEGPS